MTNRIRSKSALIATFLLISLFLFMCGVEQKTAPYDRATGIEVLIFEDDIRIECFGAGRTYSMREIEVLMLTEVSFYLFPITRIVFVILCVI